MCSVAASESRDERTHRSVICRNERVRRRGFSERKEHWSEASAILLHAINSTGSQGLLC